MSDPVILVGDVGGTNVRFALARVFDGVVQLSNVWKRPGKGFASFDAALDAFLATIDDKPMGAAFGLAGALRQGRIDMLHRNWTADRAALAAKLGVTTCVLVNDFLAMARSAPEIPDHDIVTIFEGEADPEGSLVVAGPGTGFGVAILRRMMDASEGAGGWVVVGGEGGHQAFAAETDLEVAVADILRRKLGYVSNEIIASGSGYTDTLAALAEAMGEDARDIEPEDLTLLANAGDPLARAMCELRARTVMTAVGNMAIASAALGGVYLAGGVTQTLVDYFHQPEIKARFYNRGDRAGLVKDMPVKLIISTDAPLIGAAHLWMDRVARGWL